MSRRLASINLSASVMPTTSSKSAKPLRLTQMNLEGLSHEQCQYLARVLTENDIDVAVVQETHASEASSPQRYKIHGYYMSNAMYHPKHDTAATYVRETSMRDQWSWIPTKVTRTSPPSKCLSSRCEHHQATLRRMTYTCSTHTATRYLSFSPLQDRLLARYCFVTCDDQRQPLPRAPINEPHFPNSQHTSIITIGLGIRPLYQPSRRCKNHRWNFRKANWPELTQSITETINRIPPRTNESETIFF